MAVYEIEHNGKIIELEADTPQQAATTARLYLAGRGRADDIAQSRQAEGQAALDKAPQNILARSADAAMQDAGGGFADPNATGEDIASRAANATAVLGAGATGGAIATQGIAPVLKGIGLSLAGGSAGGYAGRTVGSGLEAAGAPEGTSKVLGTAGGLVGSVAAPIGGPQMLSKIVGVGGGKGGALGQILSRVAPAAESAVAPEAAAAAAKSAEVSLAKQQADIAVRQARAAAITQKAAHDAERHALQKEILQKRLSGELPPRSIRPKVAEAPMPSTPKPVNPDATVPAKAEILPDGQRSMTAPRGGTAKPGPPATKPEELEETLRKPIDALQAGKPTSPLQPPRIKIGAEKVGKSVGMTKEDVRMQAGPVLDEVRGEASPILPSEPLKKIIDTMRAIPIAEREAYVARATSGKAKWQIENIRRTLEHLGLLLPVGAAAGGLSELDAGRTGQE